ncbi:MAG: hypothetical protein IJ060_04975 [Oscillospiraceae bacterium]|nr:hypothetical protein [Oscillospiraceae bacterium]
MQYQIMHKNTVIAKADDDRITEIIVPALCPACFVAGMPLTRWLDDRMVDTHRSHSRRLFKALRMRSNADIADLIAVGHGISITDNWWIKRNDENLDYQALKQYNEELADIALFGASDSQKGDISGYRELGTVGSFEKAWRFQDGSWYMYKQGSTQELISEYYAFRFLKAMGVRTAEYQIHRTASEETGLESVCIVTKDFTNNANSDFEPFCNYYSDREEPAYILEKLPESMHPAYVMMLFYDALLFNGDRHNQNVGFLRSSETGTIIELAPYFDYNLSLAAVGIPRIDAETGNVFTRDFLSNEVCRSILREHLPDRTEIKNSIEKATTETIKAFPQEPFRYQLFEDYILQTYDYITRHL